MMIKRIITGIVVVILILLGITFAILNATPVSLNYYIGISEISLSLLLVLVLLLGIVLGILSMLLTVMKLTIG